MHDEVCISNNVCRSLKRIGLEWSPVKKLFPVVYPGVTHFAIIRHRFCRTRAKSDLAGSQEGVAKAQEG